MSAVFCAYDTHLGGQAAIKVLYGRDAGEHKQRLYREARILEKLSHPGIVKHLAHGETADGMPYLAMEWVTGETLGRRLTRTGLTMGESVAMVTRIAESLSVTHSKGIIHRDIKPSNLLLRDTDLDRPTLIDFGIARMGLGASALTKTGVMLGTLGYMAPEQARGAKHLDARADVFALGAVLFKCLTGVPAFAGDDEIAILAKMLFETPPRLRELRKDAPPLLDNLLSRMLSRDPLLRPSDAGVVAAELAALGSLDTTGSYGAREASRHADIITRGEQRLVSVMAVASSPSSVQESMDDDGTWKDTKPLSARLAYAIHPFGAGLEALANGILVVTLPGRHSATDQATRAARCVLAMRTAAPEAIMVLATGRAELDARVPTGDAVDRALRMLEARPGDTSASASARPPIRIDGVTAGLLDTRFVVRTDGAGIELVSEQAAVDPGRMLLGKPTPCVGRERELVMLEGYFAECVADDVARVVLVTAPAGVGKSRLRYELLRTLHHRGDPHEVWTTRGDPMRAGSPFGLLAQILRAAAASHDGEPARVQREKLRARVGRHVAESEQARVTQFLAEVLSISMLEGADVQLRAARHDPRIMGDQMRRAFEDWLHAECTAQPIVIVLEDLHWGDLPSVTFIDAGLRAVQDKPLMVLALARPEVKDLFPELFAERGVHELRLKDLSKKASERLVRQVLGNFVTEPTVAQIVTTAAGNAFYLEELIRAVAAAAPGAPLGLPETVLSMVQARLGALEPEARRLLRAASVFGQTFWRGGVVALLAGQDGEAHVTAWLDELCLRESVTRREETRFHGEQEYVFRHAFIAEAAYSMLTDKDRSIGHKLAAEWLESVGESEAVVLAEHLARGGEPKRAIGFYRRAAAQALEGNDLEACLQRANAGMACGAEGEVLGRLALRKAEAHRWRGEHIAAKACAEQALKLLPRGGQRWFLAAGETVEASARLGDEGDLHRTVDELCEVGEQGTVSPPHLVALARAACVLMQAGNYPSADDLLRTIDAAFEPLRSAGDDPRSTASVYRTRAYRASVAGDAASALSLYNVAIVQFDKAGDTRSACRHVVSAAAACIELGAYGDAERALNDALVSADRMGLSGVRAIAVHHMGMLMSRLGESAAALALADEAIKAFNSQGDHRMEGAARIYRARFVATDGELDRAHVELKSTMLNFALTKPTQAYALAILARTTLNAGRHALAEAPAREAMEIVDILGGVEEGESYIRLAFAEVLHALGDYDAAREAIGTARVRILERTLMIHDPTWSVSFVECVDENARTLELAQRWTL